MTDVVNVICMKWGTRYGPEYVNRLRSMVRRHLRLPHRFMCFTDDRTGLEPDIETAPLPPIEVPKRRQHLGWRKIGTFNRTLADLTGTALFLDLDLVITGPLDDFFAFGPGRFCIIENWTTRGTGIGNSSVYRFEIGAHADVLDRFHSQDIEHWIREYRISQVFLSRSLDDMAFWPADWCLSFKNSLLPQWPLNLVRVPRLPPSARIVAFTGKPDPDEALEGRWPGVWYKRFYRHVRPTPWIGEHWR